MSWHRMMITEVYILKLPLPRRLCFNCQQLFIKTNDRIFYENFTRYVSSDREEVIKFWKSYTDSSTL